MSTCDNFESICLKHQEKYRASLAACPEVTSDYAFANLYGWAEHYGMQWRIAHDLVWIKQTIPQDIMWAPVGDWTKVDWAALPCLAGPARFTRVPEALLGIWRQAFGDRLSAVEARDHFDYVYSVPELVELKGNKFHKKKNLLHQFEKSNIFEYTPMQADCVEEVLDMQAEWHGWQEHPSEALVAENQAISRVLKNFDRLGNLMGGTIRIGGKVVAYTVGESLSKDTIVIHFEKGDTSYHGVYSVINQLFVSEFLRDVQYVNRQEDAGVDGLRKAKLSYQPDLMVRKYRITKP